MILPQLFFPHRSDWREVNLNNLARLLEPKPLYPGKNPLIDPELCREWVDAVSKATRCQNIWGGWFEDRGYLWRDSYIQSPKTIHLGIDFWVPAGDAITVPRDAEIVDIWEDDEEPFGWGNAVVLRDHVGYYVVGHLSGGYIRRTGTEIRHGEVLGYVGTSAENGGWAPHVHIQCSKVPFDRTIDGYGDHEESLRWMEPRAFFNADPEHYWTRYNDGR